MADIHFRKYTAGKLVQSSDNRQVVDIIFNEDLVQRTERGENPKERETLLWVNWGTDDHGKSVFSAITLSTQDPDDGADTVGRITHILKSTNGTMSHFVTNMLKVFRARVQSVTLCPVTFVMRHARREDFKSMLNNGLQLRRVFRELMSELHAPGKLDIKIKLLSHSPNPPTHEECESHKSSLQRLSSTETVTHEMTDPGNLLIEERFSRIDEEVAKQKQFLEKNIKQQKQQSEACREILSRINLQLHPQTKEGLLVSIDDDRHEADGDTIGHLNQSTIPTSATDIQLDTVGKSQTVSESGKPVTDTLGSTSTTTSTDGLRQHLIEGKDIEVDAVEEDRSIPLEHETVKSGSGSSNVAKGDKEKQTNEKVKLASKTKENSKYDSPVVEDIVKELKGKDSITTSTNEMPGNRSVGINKITAHVGNTSKTYSPISTEDGPKSSGDGVFKKPPPPRTDALYQQTKQSSQINETYATQQYSNTKDYYSTSYIYPKDNSNTYGNSAGKGSYNPSSDGSVTQLYHSSRYYTEYSPNDGFYVTTRETDYTLYTAAGEEKWTKLVRYRKGTPEPNIMDNLPYNLVPVSAQRCSYALPGSSESYSGIEKLLVRMDIAVSKEETPKGQKEKSPVCTLNYLRELLGDGDSVWESAEEALQSETCPVPRVQNATDTLLCLDVSSSTSRESYHQLKTTALSFISGVEDIAEELGVEENIAIVTLGSKAKVVHHLTNDYESLRDAIEEMECCARSSKTYLEGILVCLAALTKGGVCNFGGFLRVPPRLIVVTDGLTPEKMDQCRDSQALQEMGSEFVRSNVVSPILVVPHGNPNVVVTDYLKTMVRICKGEIVYDIKSACSYQRMQKFCAQIIRYVKSQCGLKTSTAANVDIILDCLSADFSATEKNTIRSIVRDQLDLEEKDAGDTTLFNNIQESTSCHILLQLGTRVARGPDWKWANEDSDCPGTVINHGPNHGMLWVVWDNALSNTYRYGYYGSYDVWPVEDRPRLLGEDGDIDIGVQVERGPDWLESYSDQDGGPKSYGTVIRKRGGRVMVLWRNGDVYEYRFGENGKYDLTARDPAELLMDSQQNNPDGERSAGKHEKQYETKQQISGSRSSYTWQWLDPQGVWQTYSPEQCAKLSQTYSKRPDGSCLVQKNGKSFRVSFRNQTEKSVDDHTVTQVRRT
ncbi:uncharacterized protein LOC124280411 isoform X2 [Haliotis rubra]|uniref:uncharacterized protein LOC124280411 isoform X2 n=1 Tax=Haliotis rubra TaxID=36100 RepID=UPI001EE5D3A3|nr:uncharacterized protein LOC124280411 isoform X2 [Haliotis rubra]